MALPKNGIVHDIPQNGNIGIYVKGDMASCIISRWGCYGNMLVYTEDINLRCTKTNNMIWVCLKTLGKPQNIMLGKLSVPIKLAFWGIPYFQTNPKIKSWWLNYQHLSTSSLKNLDKRLSENLRWRAGKSPAACCAFRKKRCLEPSNGPFFGWMMPCSDNSQCKPMGL